MKRIGCLCFLLFVGQWVFSQERVQLDYHFEKSDLGEDVLRVKGKILNVSAKDIYFYSESCNDLDYLLSTSTDTTSIYIFFYCNMTFPRKNVVKAYSFFEFTTHVKFEQEKEKLGLNLKFIELHETIKVDANGYIQNYNQSRDVKQVTTIKGPVISID